MSKKDDAFTLIFISGRPGMRPGAAHAGPLSSPALLGAVTTGKTPLVVIGGLLAELAGPGPGDTVH